MGLSSGTRFDLRHMFRLRGCVWKAHTDAGMRDSFGIVQLSGKPGERREKAGSPEAEVYLSLLQPRSHGEGVGDSHGVARWLMEHVFVVNICSCLRRLVI